MKKLLIIAINIIGILSAIIFLGELLGFSIIIFDFPLLKIVSIVLIFYLFFLPFYLDALVMIIMSVIFVFMISFFTLFTIGTKQNYFKFSNNDNKNTILVMECVCPVNGNVNVYIEIFDFLYQKKDAEIIKSGYFPFSEDEGKVFWINQEQVVVEFKRTDSIEENQTILIDFN